MSTYKIAVIGGDGIGPEVIAEGLKVLDAASKKHGFKLETTEFDFGGSRYLKTEETLSDAEIEILKGFDAIYLGAVGHPDVRPGILEKEILLKLRFDLDLYINLRPVKLYKNVKTLIKDHNHESVDYYVVRENTGGLYTGEGEFQNKNSKDEVAVQKMIYSYRQVERCIRYTFKRADSLHRDHPWRGLSGQEKKNGFIGKVTLCGKTNVLTYVYDLWERTFNEVARDYPNIITDYVHVDAMCMSMIESPQRFNWVVTGNMFGDIITDLAAVTQVGLGVAPSGNINPDPKKVSMFEPVHGSAPQFTGKNMANPIAAIATVHMMLAYLNENKAAENLESAIQKTITSMKSMLIGKMGYSTTEIGDMVVSNL